MLQGKITISKRQAALIGWLAGLLTFLLLLSMPLEPPIKDSMIWITIITLTILMLNFGLTFSEGEINAAHSVGIMSYLLLDNPEEALWVMSIGVLIGIPIREARRHYWQDWGLFFRELWIPLARTLGQLILGLAIGGWAYKQLDGLSPLVEFEVRDVLPLLGFVAFYLAVYLALLLIQMRSREGRNFNKAIRLNWQSMIGILWIPVPMAVLSAVIYHAVSPLAFALSCAGLAIMIMGVYGLSHTQHRYEQQVRDLSTLATISNAMRTNLYLESLLQTLYLQVASLLDVNNFTIALYDPARETVYFPIHIRDSQPNTLPEITYEGDHPAERPTRQIPKYIIDKAPELGIIPAHLPRVSWLGSPILTSNQTVGAILIAADSAERQFTPQEQQLLSTIAAQSGVALDNAQLYEQSRQRIKQLRTLTNISAQLSSTLNAQRALDHIASYAKEVVGADAAAIYMWWDEAKQTLVLVRQKGFTEKFVANSPTPILAHDPNRRHSVVITDSHKDKEAAEARQILDLEGKRAWVEVPLRNASDLLGVLVVYYNTPHLQSDEDIEVLMTYANQAALALSNAELYSSKDAALSRRVEQLTLLEVLGHELFSSRIQLEAIYEQVLKRAVEGTGAHAGLLVLKDEQNPRGKIVSMLGYPTETIQNLEIHHGITKHVLETADATIVGDNKADQRFASLRSETRSLLSVPILHDISIIGVITLESNTPHCFGNEDMIFVMQVGAQIRIALDNVRLIHSIEATRDRLQTILDSMTEAMILINTKGEVRLANPRVASILELNPTRLVNQSVAELLTIPHLEFAEKLGFQPNELRGISTGLSTGHWKPEDTRVTYKRTKNAQTRFIERNDVAVRDQNGSVIGWLMVFVDATEERELTQAREDLYHMIVHDLRSPLTAINASLKLINNVSATHESIRPIIEQTTETAGRAVRKLLNMVNSLLDISKMESGTMVLEREPSSPLQIAASVIQELEPLAQEMDVRLETDIPDGVPMVNVDAEKIERVLLNLVDNAIKFTPSRGKVWIRIHIHEGNGSANKPMLHLQVIDNGPGIPDEYKQRLFERYVQVEGQRGRRRGTGLGLTFCRLAVEAHGGSIWVEDNPQGGSIFEFTVPTLSDNDWDEFE